MDDERGISDGAIVGARKRPDGTLDLSHGLIAVPDDPVKAKEVSRATRAEITDANERIRRERIVKPEDTVPGSIGAVAERIQQNIDNAHRSSNRPETVIDTTQGRQRNLTQLRLKREILDTVMDEKADELKKEQVDKDRASGLGFSDVEVDKGDVWYRRFRGDAKKMVAGEAADRLEKLVQGWEETLPQTTDLEDRVQLESRIQAARTLYLQLIEEEIRSAEEISVEKPVKENSDKSDKVKEMVQPQEAQVQIEVLENQAKELAALTRAEGVGQLFGFVYPIGSAKLGFVAGEGFSRGEVVMGDSDRSSELKEKIGWTFPPREVRDGYEYPDRQIWMMDPYDRNKVFQRITYDFFTETPFDTRPGVGVNLSVVVPTELANRINSVVSENPDLADAYFKALFPDVVGRDGSTHIRRKPATELLILDRRENPINIQGEVKRFTSPIEY